VLSSSGRSDVSPVIPRAEYPCQLRVCVVNKVMCMHAGRRGAVELG